MATMSLEELTATVKEMQADYTEALDTIWMLLAGCLVFFMHAGFSFREAGSSRAYDIQRIVVKNILVILIGFLCWWAVGWAFAFGIAEHGVSDFIGHSDFLSANFFEDKVKFRLWFFQGIFCATAAAIVSGAVGERLQWKAFGLLVVALTSLIYPIVAYWGWSGRGFLAHPSDDSPEEMESLAGPPFMDFAGSGLVHLVGGVAALVSVLILGPRKGRFEDDDDEESQPNNVPFIVLGTFFMWFGWYGFNPGSSLAMSSREDALTAGRVAVNTTLAPCTAGMLVFSLRAFFLPPKLLDVAGLCNGVLAGLVSISAGCAAVEPWEAAFIGFGSGFVYCGASLLMRMLKIDDAVDAVAVHGACGLLGIIAVGFLGNPETTGGNGVFYGGDQLGVQIVAGIFITFFVGATTAAVVVPLYLVGWLRVPDEPEEEGSDVLERARTAAKLHHQASVESV